MENIQESSSRPTSHFCLRHIDCPIGMLPLYVRRLFRAATFKNHTVLAAKAGSRSLRVELQQQLFWKTLNADVAELKKISRETLQKKDSDNTAVRDKYASYVQSGCSRVATLATDIAWAVNIPTPYLENFDAAMTGSVFDVVSARPGRMSGMFLEEDDHNAKPQGYATISECDTISTCIETIENGFPEEPIPCDYSFLTDHESHYVTSSEDNTLSTYVETIENGFPEEPISCDFLYFNELASLDKTEIVESNLPLAKPISSNASISKYVFMNTVCTKHEPQESQHKNQHTLHGHPENYAFPLQSVAQRGTIKRALDSTSIDEPFLSESSFSYFTTMPPCYFAEK